LSKLDDALAQHPMIGLAAQIIGTPGKKGRPRKELSRIQREPEDDPEALVRGRGILLSEGLNAEGKWRAVVSFHPDPSFDMLKFRRALHYLAFNNLALTAGVDGALDPRWDRLRSYIRKPQPREAWPFAQVTPKAGEMPPVVKLDRVEHGSVELTEIRIFGAQFAVELTESGRVQQLAESRGWVYVGPEERNPIGLTFELGEP
jgi:hypothetical protein